MNKRLRNLILKVRVSTVFWCPKCVTVRRFKFFLLRGGRHCTVCGAKHVPPVPKHHGHQN